MSEFGIQQVSWLGTAVAAIAAVFKLASESRAGRLSRETDMRWKQAVAGKGINDELMEDENSWAALRMIDYPGRKFELPDKTIVCIDEPDLVWALNPHNDVRGAKDIYIRDCFDTLFYYMATFQHYQSQLLIRREDVAFPIDYYVLQLADYAPEVRAYLTTYGLNRAHAFLRNNMSWPSLGDIPILSGPACSVIKPEAH